MRQILILATLTWVACGRVVTLERMDSTTYITMTTAKRKAKDNQFLTDKNSPIIGLSEEFTGLNYYPIQWGYRLPIQLPQKTDSAWVTLTDTKGGIRKYQGKGAIFFQLEGKQMELWAYRQEEYGVWFIPFRDMTSGRESYGGGRYIEIKGNAGDSAWLDFNEAYQPYCHYNPRFSCPVVPTANHLPIPIRAGERLYHVENH